MVAFGECGFAAEIPAFAGMEGGGMIARIFREAEHCIGRLWRMRLRRRDSGFRRNGRRGEGASLFWECDAKIQLEGGEIPAFAGMGIGGGNGNKGRE